MHQVGRGGHSRGWGGVALPHQLDSGFHCVHCSDNPHTPLPKISHCRVNFITNEHRKKGYWLVSYEIRWTQPNWTSQDKDMVGAGPMCVSEVLWHQPTQGLTYWCLLEQEASVGALQSKRLGGEVPWLCTHRHIERSQRGAKMQYHPPKLELGASG